MYWADLLAEEIKEKYKAQIKAGKPLVIRDEKTASGRVHVGSLRGVAIHGIISEILKEEGINNKFLYEINDFDPMDSIPVYLDREKFLPHMGKPLCNIFSPDGKAKNYAEYFAEEFIGVINEIGFEPEFYRNSELYKSGKYNEAIKIVLENTGKIREIYKTVSGSIKPEDWLPLQVVCENCGKIGTTKVVSFDGEKVEYICEPELVEWTTGCGHKGKISPFNGNAKLPWKVEWAAKFFILNVDIEGAGKDHSTKGGSRDIADAICREIFKREPPFNIPYEFFHVAGKKMSASKGEGSSSREIADLFPPEILRLLLLGKHYKQVIDFVPDGDTVPILFDRFDELAENYFKNIQNGYKRLFELIFSPEKRKKIKEKFLPRFSQIAFLVQMPHMDLVKEVEKMKAAPLTEEDRAEIDLRIKYAKRWLNLYAPEDYKYELQEEKIPEPAKKINQKQREALKDLLEYVKSQEFLDGQTLHTKIHEIKERLKIEPREFFSAIYLSFLGKESGPKAGWFLSILDKKFLEKRLAEVIEESGCSTR